MPGRHPAQPAESSTSRTTATPHDLEQMPRLLDVTGAAALLGLSKRAVEKFVLPELGRIKVGRAFWYDREDLLGWVDEHKALGPETAPATSTFMTLSETARFLRVTVRTLTRWQHEGRIHGVKLTATRQGRKVFRRAEVERFVSAAEEPWAWTRPPRRKRVAERS